MLINKKLASAKRKHPMPGAPSVLCLLILLAPLAAGCTQQKLAQATVATPTTQATTEASPVPAATASAGAPTATATVAASETTTPQGTPTPRPTPTGAPPASPLDVLNIFGFTSAEKNLVKRDALQLIPGGPEEVMYTMTGPDPVITSTESSWVGVLTYDPVYREWSQVWLSPPITGTASPLPVGTRSDGYNGANLLGASGGPVLVARTTTKDSRAHLFLWRWDAAKKQGVPLKMLPAGGGAEKDAGFDADLDINVIDLDGDGVYEVVADNIAGVQVWKWDGSRYVPQGGR